MTLAFSDTFDRVNGAPGAAWTQVVGSWSIDTDRLKGPSSGQLRCNTTPAGPNVCVQYDIPAYATSSKSYSFRLRESNNRTDYILVTFSQQASTFVLQVQTFVSGVQQSSASWTIAYDHSYTESVRVAAIGYNVWCWVDTFLLASTQIPAVLGGGDVVVGSGQANTFFDNFLLYDLADTASTLDIVPDGELAGRYQITVHNFGPAWTVGTPGSPVFECRAGSIVEQEVTDVDTCVLVWDAPSVITVEQLNDPAYATYYTFDLEYLGSSSGASGGGGGLSTIQAGILTKLGLFVDGWADPPNSDHQLTLDLGAIRLMLHNTYTYSDGSALGSLLDAILSEGGTLRTIDTLAEAILDLLNDTTDSGNWTLQYAWGQIKGGDNRDNTQLYDLITGLSEGTTSLDTVINLLWEIRTVAHSYTLGSVMDAIAALEAPDLSAVLDAIDAVRGIGGFDLTNVMTAIAAIDIPDPATQLDTIDDHVLAIPTNPITSLEPVLDAIDAHDGNLDAKAQAILDAIGDLPTNPITSLQTVLDAIDLLKTFLGDEVELVLDAIALLVPAEPPPAAPVWPGLAGVTFGSPVALAQGVTVSGPMHGVVIDISSVLPETDHYDFDGEPSYLHIGQLAFANDDGAFEGFQPFSFSKQLMTPTRMTEASTCVLRCALGVTGTVTPWSIAAPTP